MTDESVVQIVIAVCTATPIILGQWANLRRTGRVEVKTDENTRITKEVSDKTDENTRITEAVKKNADDIHVMVNSNLSEVRADLKRANEQLARVLEAMVDTVKKTAEASVVKPPDAVIVDRRVDKPGKG